MRSTTVAITGVVAIKLVVALADPTVRIYLGDSAAYLWGALDEGRLPDDRSFVYSLILRALVQPFADLGTVLWWQTLAGIATALLVWSMLRRLHVRPVLAAVAACALALEPAQVFYERMVLAETWGLLAMLLFVWSGLAYLRSGRSWWLPLVAVAGLLAVSLRMNYLPVVLLLSMLLPSLMLLQQRRPAARRVVGHLLLAAVAVAVLHSSYRIGVGRYFHLPPGYLARTGFLQLGLVVPLVQRRHFVRVGLPADFAATLAYPLHDPDARMQHMWSPGGLFKEMAKRTPHVELVARELSAVALREDPLGLLRLGVHTQAGFFRAEDIQHALENDLGRRQIPEAILWNLRHKWAYEAADLPTRVTLVSRWFELGTWWLVACVFVLPLVAIVNVYRFRHDPRLPSVCLLALVSIGLVCAHVLFTNLALYRYLHPLPPFVLIHAMLLGTTPVRPEGRPAGLSDR